MAHNKSYTYNRKDTNENKGRKGGKSSQNPQYVTTKDGVVQKVDRQKVEKE